MIISKFFYALDLSAILVMCMIFSVFIDYDHIYTKYIKKKKRHFRTWMQEPFAIILIGLPIGLILGNLIDMSLLYLVLIVYTSHILLDYLCVFEASPLAPFDNKPYKKTGTGIFKMTRKGRFKNKIYQKYFEIFNNVLFVILLLI